MSPTFSLTLPLASSKTPMRKPLLEIRGHPVCTRVHELKNAWKCGIFHVSGELRQHLVLVEVEEAVLLVTDLVHVDVLVAGVEVLADCLDVALGIGAARHQLG